MKFFIAGATGATGRLLLEQLLMQGHDVSVVIRSSQRLPLSVRNNNRLFITEDNLLDLGDDDLARLVRGCDAVASCLGHTLNLKGIFGKPRKLVTEATARLCCAIEENQPEKPVRFVLMNTSGNRNPDLPEKRSWKERLVIGLVRALIPPHSDNEQAAEHLRVAIGKDAPSIAWVAVRPDTLVDENEVSEYELHPSPIRSPIFNPGQTSRINVADFMSRLMTEDELWSDWKGKMPLIYNKTSK
jgi:nucleoside-diphosphate-sugar epimerase